MNRALSWLRDRLDRVGMTLSCLCAVHCVATVVLVAGLGLSGTVLLNPAIHDIGLILAMAIAAFAIGAGTRRHGHRLPLAVAAGGLCFMGAGLTMTSHVHEAFLTIIGVSLVVVGHLLNIRHLHRLPHLHPA